MTARGIIGFLGEFMRSFSGLDMMIYERSRRKVG